MAETLIIITILLVIFGIAYYYLTTRNKERMALIQAGASPKIFKSGTNNALYILFVLGMLAIGIAIGTGFGFILERFLISMDSRGPFFRDQNQFGNQGNREGAYVVTIFLFGGLSLITSFFMIRKWTKKNEEEFRDQ
ncbi:hypothetical protein QQ008_20135 [Fulvivirgaceae bacterium BMA10]|uniref:DUF6249 domain-containing protein n=1 Tax=Splendidivirga corallicola TaxID=3051826 RepID=A0ABT8KSG9_9BACT|nr:hypothetical protein [Fulvivirgaceae bacterium BMA10]